MAYEEIASSTLCALINIFIKIQHWGHLITKTIKKTDTPLNKYWMDFPINKNSRLTLFSYPNTICNLLKMSWQWQWQIQCLYSMGHFPHMMGQSLNHSTIFWLNVRVKFGGAKMLLKSRQQTWEVNGIFLSL